MSSRFSANHLFANYQRRKFMQLSLLTIASSLLTTNQVLAKQKKAKIIVIGAGMAGLAAARQLQAQGFAVTVLEGRNRLGGRIFTNRSLGIPIDLGASWIHGINNNPITKLAKDWQIKLLRTDYYNLQLFDLMGKMISDQEFEQAYSRYETIIKKAKSYSENLDRDISLATALQKVLNQTQLSPQQKILMSWLINTEIVTEQAEDPANLSVWEFDEDESFPGDDYLFPGGYDQIIQKLAQGIEIKLNHVVQEISYNNQGVTVITNQGNFTSNATIVTLPLGVLKAGKVKFNPVLPEPKLKAINRLNMAVLNKVILQFPHVFWDNDYEAFGYLTQSNQDFQYFMNWHKYQKKFPMLMAFVGGNFARSLESLSDEQIVAKAMNVLRRNGTKSIPDPVKVMVTKWNSDRFSLGSYSAMPVGSKTSDRLALGAPVDQRLFFAGEATSEKYPATVHGAYLSGIKVSTQIGQIFG